MAILSKILSSGAWRDIVKMINENFTKINQQLESKSDETTVKLPLFKTLEEAQQEIVTPYKGQLILVGDNIPAPVYRWNGSVWEATGGNGGDATVNFDGYYSKEEIDSRIVVIKSTTEVNI